MPARYHRFAGSSLERLGALSDGVFAVAMTLLVLDLKAPAEPARTQHPIWSSGGGASEHVLATTCCTTWCRGCSRIS
jgi:TMEM175 potassium channel family protein